MAHFVRTVSAHELDLRMVLPVATFTFHQIAEPTHGIEAAHLAPLDDVREVLRTELESDRRRRETGGQELGIDHRHHDVDGLPGGKTSARISRVDTIVRDRQSRQGPTAHGRDRGAHGLTRDHPEE